MYDYRMVSFVGLIRDVEICPINHEVGTKPTSSVCFKTGFISYLGSLTVSLLCFKGWYSFLSWKMLWVYKQIVFLSTSLIVVLIGVSSLLYDQNIQISSSSYIVLFLMLDSFVEKILKRSLQEAKSGEKT